MTFEIGSHAYIIESSRIIREVVIVHRNGDFYTIKFADGNGGIRIRGSRLFATQEDAEASMPKKNSENRRGFHSPYDYWH